MDLEPGSSKYIALELEKHLCMPTFNIPLVLRDWTHTQFHLQQYKGFDLVPLFLNALPCGRHAQIVRWSQRELCNHLWYGGYSEVWQVPYSSKGLLSCARHYVALQERREKAQITYRAFTKQKKKGHN